MSPRIEIKIADEVLLARTELTKLYLVQYISSVQVHNKSDSAFLLKHSGDDKTFIEFDFTSHYFGYFVKTVLTSSLERL